MANGALVVVAVQIKAHCVGISASVVLRLPSLPGSRERMPVMQ